MNTNRFNRQVLAFGQEGQRRIAQSKIAVVGLGGIGSQVVQMLAYLGSESFTLIDHDVIDETNLNRLVGAYPGDVDKKMFKVDIAKRHVMQINPSCSVTALQMGLRSKISLDALVGADVIFGCVDHDGPRQILAELTAAYEIPFFDAASEIFPETQPIQFGGRVVLSRPGDFCLGCAHQLDWDRAKEDLDSTDVKELRRKHGYGLKELAEAPSVVSLNGIIASLAVNEFMVMVTGLRAPNRYLKYKGERGNVVFNEDPKREDCYICGYLSGLGEKSDIYRYAR